MTDARTEIVTTTSTTEEIPEDITILPNDSEDLDPLDDLLPNPVAEQRAVIASSGRSLLSLLDKQNNFAEVKNHAAAVKKDPINSIISLLKQNKYLDLKNYILDGTIVLNHFLSLHTNFETDIEKVLDLLLKEKACIPLVYKFLCSEKLDPTMKKTSSTLSTRYELYDDYREKHPDQRIKMIIVSIIAYHSDFKERLADYIFDLKSDKELIENLEKAICDYPGPLNLLGEVLYMPRPTFAIGNTTVKVDQAVPSTKTNCTLRDIFYHYASLKFPPGSKDHLISNRNVKIYYSNYFEKSVNGFLWRMPDKFMLGEYFKKIHTNIMLAIRQKFLSLPPESKQSTINPQDKDDCPIQTTRSSVVEEKGSPHTQSDSFAFHKLPGEADCIKGLELYGKGHFKAAYGCFKDTADFEYPPALVFLGLFHERGFGGIAKSEKTANSFYARAREFENWFIYHEKDDNEFYKLFYCFYYDYANKNKKDAKAVANIYRSLADKGNAFAQHRLGICYQNGDGVEKSDAEKLNWIQRASDLPIARYNLGIFFRKDFPDSPGAPQLSFDWFFLAAREGHALAQYEVAVNLYNRPDQAAKKQCVEWYRKAAEQGVAEAQTMLGWFYSNGEFVEKNESIAIKWYLEAAEHGNVIAQNNAGHYYRKNQQHDVAFKWFFKAADQGDATALYNLAECYEKGLGVNSDPATALSLYQQSALKGEADAPSKVAALEKLVAATTVRKKEGKEQESNKRSDDPRFFSQSDVSSTVSADLGIVIKNEF